MHIKNSLKLTVLMDLLKAAILVKLTKSGKPFHTLMTLQAKKLTLALLLLGLKSLALTYLRMCSVESRTNVNNNNNNSNGV